MDLLEYFENRFNKPEPKASRKLPFITISRETGCSAVQIVKLLLKDLKGQGQDWKYIDKDILIDSAKKMKIDDTTVKDVFDAKTKTHADEILSALSSRYYKSNKAVKNTITSLVTHFAEDGNVVLVGRAGAAITGNMPRGLHIRLVAPKEWRINSFMKKSNKTLLASRKYVNDNDVKRQKLMTYFCERKPDMMCYDITINCSKFSPKMIAELIFDVMRKKKMI